MQRLERVLVIGCGGAGKSTLARELGARTGLPVVHLDVEFWRPGWIRTPDAEWERRVAELIAADRWIIDGNYSGTLVTRLGRADTVVLLDLPRSVCVRRVLWRSLVGQIAGRADLAHGCRERFDVEFLRWVWNFERSSLPKLVRRLEEHGGHTTVHRLRSDREVEAFLAGIA